MQTAAGRKLGSFLKCLDLFTVSIKDALYRLGMEWNGIFTNRAVGCASSVNYLNNLLEEGVVILLRLQ